MTEEDEELFRCFRQQQSSKLVFFLISLAHGHKNA